MLCFKVGASKVGKSIDSLVRRSNLPLDVVGFVDQEPDLVATKVAEKPVLDGRAKLSRHCRQYEIDEVVMCVGRRLYPDTLNGLIDCQNVGQR